MDKSAEERDKRIRAEHEAYLHGIAKGSIVLRQMQSSIAGASSKTSDMYRHAEAKEEDRRRAMLDELAAQEKAKAFEAEANERKLALQAQRERNKKKREKKKQRSGGVKRDRSSQSSSQEDSRSGSVEPPSNHALKTEPEEDNKAIEHSGKNACQPTGESNDSEPQQGI